MTTPFSSRRRLIIAAVVILFAATIGWFIFSSPPANTLTISFAGVEPGHGSAVGFWVTNTTRQPVYLQRFGVQVIQDGDWKTSFDNRPPLVVATKAPHSSPFSVLNLASGEYQKILVTRPTNTVWRAALAYSSESKGFRVWAIRVRLALARRNLSLLHVTVWSADRTNFSDTITNAPPGR